MLITAQQGSPYGGMPHLVVIDSAIRYVCLDDKSIGECACGNSSWIEVPCPYCHTEGEHDCSEVSVPYVKHRFKIGAQKAVEASLEDHYAHTKAFYSALAKKMRLILDGEPE